MTHPLSRTEFRSKADQRFILNNETYKLGGKLGDGAVGVVRKATSSDGVEFAVKFLAPDPKYIEPTHFDDVAERFRHEGLRGARLEHPTLVRIHAYAENKNGEIFLSGGPHNPFLVMERVRGRTLENEIRSTHHNEQGNFDITRNRLFIALQLADALNYLHKKKIVHRDVKPANIFLSTNQSRNRLPYVRLGDFGVVKWGDFHQSLATGTLTVTGQQGLGTLKYMSPEQAMRPKDVTTKSDVFSFGITLHEIFTGEILASPHHVFHIMNARLQRGNTYSRYRELGLEVGQFDYLAGKLLECFLRGIKGRPTIEHLMGCLSALYTELYNKEWQSECD